MNAYALTRFVSRSCSMLLQLTLSKLVKTHHGVVGVYHT